MSRAGGDSKFNLVIRTIIHGYVTQVRAIERKNLDLAGVQPVEIDLSGLEFGEGSDQ